MCIVVFKSHVLRNRDRERDEKIFVFQHLSAGLIRHGRLVRIASTMATLWSATVGGGTCVLLVSYSTSASVRRVRSKRIVLHRHL